MTQATAKRADRASIRKSILSILKDSADAYAEHSDPTSDLRHAPEYLTTVNLAQGLTKAFPMLRYRLEHQASTFSLKAREAIDTRVAMGKDAARFDIVLLNKSNNVPRCIIEVKRGIKIIDDAKRIIAIAALESGRPRWRHGYLVTILRRSASEAERLVGELAAEIEALRVTASAALPDHQEVKVTYDYMPIGASRQNADTTQIFGAVFHVALKDRLVPEAEDSIEMLA
ncbi:hypothetical protein RCH10_003712 [Variovorax sp. GrIS 2.14]|uniref:hypothetical protein n=1 Tax=Variovorax sp. GrIS 2.14 TaxID=3071709 RepID=UPI0038F6E130